MDTAKNRIERQDEVKSVKGKINNKMAVVAPAIEASNCVFELTLHNE